MPATPESIDASDLKRLLYVGAMFYAPPYIRDDTEVVVMHDTTTRHHPHIDAGERAWSFEAIEGKREYADDNQRWYCVVAPDRGGPNGGVVYLFWITDEGELGGHHQVYPRGITLV